MHAKVEENTHYFQIKLILQFISPLTPPLLPQLLFYRLGVCLVMACTVYYVVMIAVH